MKRVLERDVKRKPLHPNSYQLTGRNGSEMVFIERNQIFIKIQTKNFYKGYGCLKKTLEYVRSMHNTI